ncbi:MAG: hypothetical protein KatS3mg102_0683 [Planctomycetota bacterium]|nr:MAG: hypothetical protein KatS3mg102_0683 [Planctomycetota bacterium]
MRAATAGWAPERLQALLRCFFEVVLARLRALEGTDFGSEEAKRRAIAGVVKSAIAEVARDPAAWMRVHCGEPRR